MSSLIGDIVIISLFQILSADNIIVEMVQKSIFNRNIIDNQYKE